MACNTTPLRYVHTTCYKEHISPASHCISDQDGNWCCRESCMFKHLQVLSKHAVAFLSDTSITIGELATAKFNLFPTCTSSRTYTCKHYRKFRHSWAPTVHDDIIDDVTMMSLMISSWHHWWCHHWWCHDVIIDDVIMMSSWWCHPALLLSTQGCLLSHLDDW